MFVYHNENNFFNKMSIKSDFQEKLLKTASHLNQFLDSRLKAEKNPKVIFIYIYKHDQSMTCSVNKFIDRIIY